MNKKHVRVIAFILALLMIVGGVLCFSLIRSEAAENDEEECEVYVRIVWHKKDVKWASASVTAILYEDPEGTVFGDDMFTFSVDRGAKWEKRITLKKGYWKFTSIQPNLEWENPFLCDGPLFEVNADVMTVYVGLCPSGESFTLPDPWIVQGKDHRSFWIWEGDGTDPVVDDNTTIDPDDYYSKLFGDDPAPVEPTLVPVETKTPVDIETPSETHQNASETTKQDDEQNKTETNEEPASAKIGTIIVFSVLGVVIVGGCVFLLIIKRRRR